MAEQVDEHVEDLWLDRNPLAIAAQLESLDVELTAIEGKAHGGSLHPSVGRGYEGWLVELRDPARMPFEQSSGNAGCG